MPISGGSGPTQAVHNPKKKQTETIVHVLSVPHTVAAQAKKFIHLSLCVSFASLSSSSANIRSPPVRKEVGAAQQQQQGGKPNNSNLPSTYWAVSHFSSSKWTLIIAAVLFVRSSLVFFCPLPGGTFARVFIGYSWTDLVFNLEQFVNINSRRHEVTYSRGQ